MILKSILSIYKQKFMSLITFVIKYICMKLYIHFKPRGSAKYMLDLGQALVKTSFWRVFLCLI